MQKISPMLWFDNQAEEAAKFYCSIFKDSKMGNVTRIGKGMHMPEGTVWIVEFYLDGQKYTALNGGPMFKFSEAISFMVVVDTQEELDHYWNKLTEGSQHPGQCGWLKDKFGLSWQVVPSQMDKWMTGPNASKVSEVMMEMQKLDMAALEKASRG